MSDGKRYLESHHIESLGEEGPYTEENVIALCANDHREAHFGADREALAARMKQIVADKLRGRRRVGSKNAVRTRRSVTQR